MDDLLEAITAVARLISQDKARVLAANIRQLDASKGKALLSDVVGTAMARSAVERVVEAWRVTSLGSDELASMLLAASHAVDKMSKSQSAELVWTGPTTPFVSARRTEQALLQVINSAKQTLFITSFVAYDVASIVKAVNEAIERGVDVMILLEQSQEHGGQISFDVLGAMSKLIPAAKLYAWRDKAVPFVGGRVHAKIAVADDRICFITSANLTGHAMEKNMEAGLLVTEGEIPQQLGNHLRSLVAIGLVSPA